MRVPHHSKNTVPKRQRSFGTLYRPSDIFLDQTTDRFFVDKRTQHGNSRPLASGKRIILSIQQCSSDLHLNNPIIGFSVR